MNGKENKQSGLIEIRDMLKGEFNKFSDISGSLSQQKEDFGKIKDTLTTYDGEIDHSGMYINKLRKREFFENLFIYIGLSIYIACIIYIMLKRFPIHRIIFLCLQILNYLISSLFNGYIHMKEIVFSSTNETIFNETIKSILNETNEMMNHSEF